MKKTLKILTMILALTALMAVVSFAESVTYSLNAIDEAAGQYDLVINVKCTGSGDVRTFATTFSFDNSVLRPADCADYSEVPLDTVTDEPIYPAEVKEGKKTYSFALTDNKWTTVDTKTTLLVSCYTTDYDKFDASDLDVLTISFVLADGKKISDIKEDDFVIEKIYLAAGENGEFGYNEPTIAQEISFTNNVVPEAPAALKITVAKDDVIYLQDGSTVVADAAGEYEIPSDDGYVVVNTGYTAQKVYKVAAGVLTEETDLEDGVLASNAASLRKDAVATGLRMKASFLTSLKTNVAEYGYLVTAETDANALPEGYELNLALAESGKAKKGVAYSAADGTDIFFDVEGERTIVTAVAVGVPMTKEAVTSNIVFRPYYKLTNGVVVYGEPTARQVYEVAKSIKDENGETYAKYQEYIDSILALLTAEEERELILETGPLF